MIRDRLGETSQNLSIELRPCLQIRRLTERLFDGVEDTLEVIGLGRNLLGDNLNPVFR